MGDGNPGRLAAALNGYGLTINEPDGRVREILPWSDLLEAVQIAERTGYEAVFAPEIGAREAFATLAGFAARTARMRLATGVVRLDRRDLRTTALAAATLDDLSGGRFVLGVGSVDTVAVTREGLVELRALLGGAEAAIDDPDEGTGAFAPPDLVPGPVPIFLAALGPQMTELAGEVADGVLLNWCVPERVSRARDEVARGAARAGRDPSAVTVAVYVRACLGHEDRHALRALAQQASTYASMPRYRRQLEEMGLGPEADRARDPEMVPEALLRALTVWGERDEALVRLDAYRQAGADLVVVYPVPAREAASSIVGTLMAAAPDPRVEW